MAAWVCTLLDFFFLFTRTKEGKLRDYMAVFLNPGSMFKTIKENTSNKAGLLLVAKDTHMEFNPLMSVNKSNVRVQLTCFCNKIDTVFEEACWFTSFHCNLPICLCLQVGDK